MAQLISAEQQAILNAALASGQMSPEDAYAFLADRTASGNASDRVNMLDPQFAVALAMAVRDAEAQTGGRANIISTNRSNAQQAEIWARSKGGTLFAAARPGLSRHEIGRAVDISRQGQSGVVLDKLHERGFLTPYGLQNLGRGDYPHIQAQNRTGPITPQAMGKDQAMQVQQILKDAGLYAGKIDGIVGPQTLAALNSYAGTLPPGLIPGQGGTALALQDEDGKTPAQQQIDTLLQQEELFNAMAVPALARPGDELGPPPIMTPDGRVSQLPSLFGRGDFTEDETAAAYAGGRPAVTPPIRTADDIVADLKAGARPYDLPRAKPSEGDRFATMQRDAISRPGVLSDEARGDTGRGSIVGRGRSNEDGQVQAVQSMLNRTMNAGLEVDGKFGRQTEQAVKAFQAANGLKADGIVGPATRDALAQSVVDLARTPVPVAKPSAVPQIMPAGTMASPLTPAPVGQVERSAIPPTGMTSVGAGPYLPAMRDPDSAMTTSDLIGRLGGIPGDPSLSSRNINQSAAAYTQVGTPAGQTPYAPTPPMRDPDGTMEGGRAGNVEMARAEALRDYAADRVIATYQEQGMWPGYEANATNPGSVPIPAVQPPPGIDPVAAEMVFNEVQSRGVDLGFQPANPADVARSLDPVNGISGLDAVSAIPTLGSPTAVAPPISVPAAPTSLASPGGILGALTAQPSSPGIPTLIDRGGAQQPTSDRGFVPTPGTTDADMSRSTFDMLFGPTPEPGAPPYVPSPISYNDQKGDSEFSKATPSAVPSRGDFDYVVGPSPAVPPIVSSGKGLDSKGDAQGSYLSIGSDPLVGRINDTMSGSAAGANVGKASPAGPQTAQLAAPNLPALPGQTATNAQQGGRYGSFDYDYANLINQPIDVLDMMGLPAKGAPTTTGATTAPPISSQPTIPARSAVTDMLGWSKPPASTEDEEETTQGGGRTTIPAIQFPKTDFTGLLRAGVMQIPGLGAKIQAANNLRAAATFGSNAARVGSAIGRGVQRVGNMVAPSIIPAPAAPTVPSWTPSYLSNPVYTPPAAPGPSGGPNYGYVTGVDPGGAPVTSYANSSGDVYSFYSNPGSAPNYAGMDPGDFGFSGPASPGGGSFGSFVSSIFGG